MAEKFYRRSSKTPSGHRTDLHQRTEFEFFYNLSNFRKRIGLKANIEMLWLPKEAFKKKNETLTLKIGKPISWQSFDKSKKPKEWAKEVREILYRL